MRRDCETCRDDDDGGAGAGGAGAGGGGGEGKQGKDQGGDIVMAQRCVLAPRRGHHYTNLIDVSPHYGYTHPSN